MRVSDRLMQNVWASALIVALTFVSAPHWLAQQAVGQTNETLADSNPATGTTQHWLGLARQEMANGDTDLASHYIQIAEAIYEKQAATQPLNYTPAMARQDLQSLQGNSGSQAPPAVATPVAGASVMPMMSTPKAAPIQDLTATARQTLLQARQALAHGHVDTARQMMASSKQYNVDWNALGDSPRNVEMMIFHQSNLEALRESGDIESFNNQAASFLMRQAKDLMSYEDFSTASDLVKQAKSFPVQFTQETGMPDQMLSMIEMAQKAATTNFSDASQSAMPTMSPKAQVMKLMSFAQLAMDKEEWLTAKSYVVEAQKLNVPDSEFAAGEARPWQMGLKIDQALRTQGQLPAMNNEVMQTNLIGSESSRVVQADYYPEGDTTRNVQVAGATSVRDNDDRLAKFPQFNPIPSRGMQLYRSGLQALDNGDQPRAKEYFEMAWKYQEQMDTGTRQAIQDHLSNLGQVSAPVAVNTQDPFSSEKQEEIEIPAVRDSQQAVFRRLQSQVFKERGAAERLLKTNPREALEKMTSIRSRIAQAELSPETRRPLLTIIDRDITEMQAYIDKNLPEIVNVETNAARKESVELRRQRKMDVEQQIQQLVEQFNKYIDEERWPEAEMVARQARELDPDSEIVALLTEKAKFAIQVQKATRLKEAKEIGFVNTMYDTDKASTPFDPSNPYRFSEDRDKWAADSRIRLGKMNEGQYGSESERQIWNLLKNEKVQGEYQGTLSEAISQLSRQAGVNIVFDNIALEAEGIASDRSVDVPIRNPISLQSALNVILESAGLVFVVEDEVIKVTSESAQRKNVFNKTYYVGDLVVPITNFNSPMSMNFMGPNSNMNNYNNQVGQNNPMMMNQQQNASISPINMAKSSAMAQQLPNQNPFNNLLNGYRGGSTGPQTGTPGGQYNTFSPNQSGGITEADFEPLVELIKSTIAPDDWDDSNGDGTIQPFVSNLSLVVSQTQEVQDQIQDLLERLRELNDVQIVVEVRFISLADSFFERIGIDFDFNINDNSGLGANALDDEQTSSSIIGRGPGSAGFNPTGDLDLQFRQDSFGTTIPQIGGFDPATAANFGFAILSDIEVFFLITATKGDTRSNVMNAPTVTLFNGQASNVSDFSNRPFVTSVTPVVGDFAVAHQPVITILPDGTTLNVQAVVSSDRRFVRMTLNPFFTQVTEVREFTFDGSTTTRQTSDSFLENLLDGVLDDGSTDSDDPDVETATEGVTIQLPVLSQQSVSTVVSVPDGGTVLLGGIKRQSETRLERGVPMLSNIPYVNRLFKNSGVGRDTSNFMMMVTPRIIIQEEEEALQVGSSGSN